MNRLDGKKKKEESVNGGDTSNTQAVTQSKVAYTRGIPDYDYQPGTIKFFRHAKPQQEKEVRFSLYLVKNLIFIYSRRLLPRISNTFQDQEDLCVMPKVESDPWFELCLNLS